MTWIRLDPQELGTTGVLLRDVSSALIDSAARVRAACCMPGLGRHVGPLMAEGESVAARTTTMTEGYLRLAVDILQRAIIAIRDGQLVSAVGTVGASIIGASVVGGTGPGWTGPGLGAETMTIGGGGPAFVGGMVLGSATPMTSVIGGSATVGGYVLDQATSMSGVIGGATTVGGTVFGGGGSMAGGVMALAQAAQNSRDRSGAILARMQAQGGQAASAGAGNQSFMDYLTRQSLRQIEDSQTRTAASSPIAGYAQAQAADATDFGGRARAMDNERYYERQRQGLT